MAVTFRDRVDVERATALGDDGTPETFEQVASNVRAFFWESLEKRIAVEGEVYVTSANVLVDPAVTLQRRDVVIFDERRFEVMLVFPARTIRNQHKFNHAVLREADV